MSRGKVSLALVLGSFLIAIICTAQVGKNNGVLNPNRASESELFALSLDEKSCRASSKGDRF